MASDIGFSLLPTVNLAQDQERAEDKSTHLQSSSDWLSSAAKGFSEIFASFTARFGSSKLSQTGKAPAEGAGKTNMFSSSGNWSSSFSLRDWIPKGVSLSFEKKNNSDETSRGSFYKESAIKPGSILARFSAKTAIYNASQAKKTLNDDKAWQYFR